jgi:predicted DNA-binding ribbon-helix-helix protein
MSGEGEIFNEPHDEGVPSVSASASTETSPPWEQRILQLDGRRYSLRLEHEFWSALEAIAERRRLRLNRLVAEIANYRPIEGNLSSTLRVFCLGEIERPSSGRTLAGDRTSITALVETAPLAGMVIDADQVVIAVNDDFVRWSGLRRALMLQQRLATHFHFQGFGQSEGASGWDGFWTRPAREEQTRIVGVIPGRVLAAEARLVPVLSARGRRLCVVWVMG